MVNSVTIGVGAPDRAEARYCYNVTHPDVVSITAFRKRKRRPYEKQFDRAVDAFKTSPTEDAVHRLTCAAWALAVVSTSGGAA